MNIIRPINKKKLNCVLLSNPTSAPAHPYLKSLNHTSRHPYLKSLNHTSRHPYLKTTPHVTPTSKPHLTSPQPQKFKPHLTSPLPLTSPINVKECLLDPCIYIQLFNRNIS